MTYFRQAKENNKAQQGNLSPALLEFYKETAITRATLEMALRSLCMILCDQNEPMAEQMYLDMCALASVRAEAMWDEE